MGKDLIETPRYNFFIGDEVFLKGKIVGFDVDENKYVENVIRLEYGQTLNVPNINIYTKNDITDKSKIKVKVPQEAADWYEENKDDFETSLFQCIYEIFKKRNDNELNEFENWVIDENTEPFKTLVNMHQFGYEVEAEKRYLVKIRATKHYFAKDGTGKMYFSLKYKSYFTKKGTRKRWIRLGFLL